MFHELQLTLQLRVLLSKFLLLVLVRLVLCVNQDFKLSNLAIEFLNLLISTIDLLLQPRRLLLQCVNLLALPLVLLLKESAQII